MSIPYNPQLNWSTYCSNPQWHEQLPATHVKNEVQKENIKQVAINEVFEKTVADPIKDGVQFVRDAARLVLKVPIRSIITPIFLSRNWKEYERAKINAKLTGYSFVQWASCPAKFLVALTALATVQVSAEKTQWLIEMNNEFVAYLDGRASQLEALKEVGRIHSSNQAEYAQYKNWLYSIQPKYCRQVS